MRPWRRAGGVLLLLALWLKLFVPQGWMPGTSIAQPIIICTGQGPMPMMMVMEHDSRHRPGDVPAKHGDQPCAFSALGAATLASTLPVIAPLRLEPVYLQAIVRVAAAPGRGLAAPPPPSRAPPPLHA